MNIRFHLLVSSASAIIMTGVAAYSAHQQKKLNTIIAAGEKQIHEDAQAQMDFMRNLARV